jgi:hypothetical protein
VRVPKRFVSASTRHLTALEMTAFEVTAFGVTAFGVTAFGVTAWHSKAIGAPGQDLVVKIVEMIVDNVKTAGKSCRFARSRKSA